MLFVFTIFFSVKIGYASNGTKDIRVENAIALADLSVEVLCSQTCTSEEYWYCFLCSNCKFYENHKPDGNPAGRCIPDE